MFAKYFVFLANSKLAVIHNEENVVINILDLKKLNISLENQKPKLFF